MYVIDPGKHKKHKLTRQCFCFLCLYSNTCIGPIYASLKKNDIFPSTPVTSGLRLQGAPAASLNNVKRYDTRSRVFYGGTTTQQHLYLSRKDRLEHATARTLSTTYALLLCVLIKTQYKEARSRSPRSCNCDHHALLTFLQRLLAFVPRSRGVSSALSGNPRKLQRWMLYNGNRCMRSNIKLNVDDYVKSSICKIFQDLFKNVDGIHTILFRCFHLFLCV